MNDSTGFGDRRIPDERWANRACADVPFFVRRTGCPWKARDATDLGPASTARDRFRDGARAGVFLRPEEGGLSEPDGWKGFERDRAAGVLG